MSVTQIDIDDDALERVMALSRAKTKKEAVNLALQFYAEKQERAASIARHFERAQHWHDFAAIVPVSATTGDGVDRLERVLLDHLPEGEPGFPDDYLTDQPERVLVA